MLDNNTYNLMAQITQESKSLWRIKETYKRDAGGCHECMEFWDKLTRDKEEHIKELERLIRAHVGTMETARR